MIPEENTPVDAKKKETTPDAATEATAATLRP